MREKEELVEVKLKLPKKLVQTLEKLAYFGWTLDEFFDNAARSYLSSTTSEFDIDECRAIEKEHGEELFYFQHAPILRPGEMQQRIAKL